MRFTSITSRLTAFTATRRRVWLIHAFIANIFLYFCGTAAAQSVVTLPIRDLGLGINTLPKGSSFEIDTPEGLRCRANDGDDPAFLIYGGGSSGDQRTDFTASAYGLGAGVAFIMPLGKSVTQNCKNVLHLHEAAQKLALAQRLFEAGLMTEAEVKSLAEDIKQQVFP